MANLVFADTKAKPEKSKRAISLANARIEMTEEKVTLKTKKVIKTYGKKERKRNRRTIGNTTLEIG